MPGAKIADRKCPELTYEGWGSCAEETAIGSSENFIFAERIKYNLFSKNRTFSLDKGAKQPIMWPEVVHSGQK